MSSDRPKVPATPAPPDVTVITVTYQSAGLIEPALRSATEAAEAAGLRLETIVVDNASSDGSADVVAARVPDARVIRNAENRGFGAANNQAFAAARGEAWLLLNPDARLARGALAALVAVLRARPAAGAVAPSIGGAWPGAESAGMRPSIRSVLGHFLFVNRLLPADRGGPWRGFQLQRRPGLGPRLVEWASAACLLIRPSAIRAVGGFDESIFLYGEDVELCKRLVAAGWDIWLEPGALASHAIAGSQGGVSSRWVDALHDLYARGAGRARLAFFDLVVGVGLGLRAAAARGPSRAIHRRRMAAGAARALTLAFRAMRANRSAIATPYE